MRLHDLINLLPKGMLGFRCDSHDSWRPAMTSKGPARYCTSCKETEQLTEAEFYAYFGFVPQQRVRWDK